LWGRTEMPPFCAHSVMEEVFHREGRTGSSSGSAVSPPSSTSAAQQRG
jgi:hypothetical protein